MLKNSKIRKIKAREILDSRGNPTIEVELFTDIDSFLASVPSGVSTGKHEAKELRDEGKRYKGKGVLKAIKNIEEIIAPKLKGLEIDNQKKIDEILINLDSTKNKSNLGANAILPVSMAVCRAGAATKNFSLYKYITQLYRNEGSASSFAAPYPRPTRSSLRNTALIFHLPRPAFNIINGGAHAGNDLDFQEFMIVPNFKEFSKNLQAGSEIYHTLKEILKKDFGKTAVNVGDEGGFAPNLSTAEQALDLIMKAIKVSDYENKINIALDVAASEFYKDGKYREKTRDEMIDYYLKLIKKYPIISIEDPFDQDDFRGWEKLSSKLKVKSSKFLIIGDDLLVTNPERIKIAKEKNLCNGLLLKINQIGTISEAIEAAKITQSFNWKIMVSHRSGETNDDFIADLSVGIGADYIKSGAPARGERVAKYNRLLKIEQELNYVVGEHKKFLNRRRFRK